jgi:hypothetical protein
MRPTTETTAAVLRFHDPPGLFTPLLQLPKAAMNQSVRQLTGQLQANLEIIASTGAVAIKPSGRRRRRSTEAPYRACGPVPLRGRRREPSGAEGGRGAGEVDHAHRVVSVTGPVGVG